jgi:formamidopyrimidine-DNA glycosylase
MPELPEVETVKRGLNRLIIGKTIRGVQVFDSPKSFPNDPVSVEHFLYGSQVVAVRRRAKVLLIDLSTEYTLVIHLKMTGQLVYIDDSHFREGRDSPESISGQSEGAGSSMRFGAGHPNDSLIGELPDRSTRVAITFIDGSHLYFNDQRKFGWIKLYPTVEVPNIDFMQRVGPEPLEDSFTARDFVARIRRRNGTTVKAAILDQTVLAGVGNIYADESLWGARIHPTTRVKDVTDEQLAELLSEIKYVMNLSIEKGGSTNKNYVNAEGKKGSYIDFARVFRQEGKPCPRHPDAVIEKIRVAGRGTHICPICQPLTY